MPLVNCLIDGQVQIHLEIEDRAIHYGDGLFETMLYQQGEIALWSQHYSRLIAGCVVLGLTAIDEKVLLNNLNVLTKELNDDSYLIKLIVSRGSAGRGLQVDKSIPSRCIFLAYDYKSTKNVNEKKHLMVCNTRLLMNKTLGGIKHLNRLLYVMAAEELNQNYSEGIMLNDKNEMVECITNNLFFVKDDTLFTAPIVDCGVAGIKRQQVLQTAKKMGITVKIKAVLLENLKQMDECFITNAVVGLQSVHSVNQVIFSKQIMTQQLQSRLK